jgi:hypothetical protein
MTRFAIFSIALLAAVPAAAQDQSQPPPGAQEAAGAPSAKLENLLENCDAHKFETMVDSLVDGQPHRSKVKMCGKEGQSDADWIGTLKDAVAKLEANKEMPEATRDQIVSAINAEIARLSGAGALNANDALPPGRSASKSPEPLSNDYTLLPPLKNTAPPPPRLLPPAPSAAATGEGSNEASVPTSVAAGPPPAPKLAMANPRLSFSCISPEFPGGGPCVTLTRDTIVTVKSPAAVPGALSLRFVRQGDARAEIALGSMRKGQSLRLSLPQAVCSGVVTSEVEMQVVGGGQVLDRQGPYLLRC